MEFIESLFTKTSTFFNTTNTNQKLWIKTTDNQTICCNQETIELSALLTVAHQSGLFRNKNNALSTNVTTKDLALFIASSTNQTKNFFNYLPVKKHYALATIAYTLKSPKLYAQLIKIIMPSDIDHQIAHIAFSIKKIKNLMIKNTPLKTAHHKVEIPLIDNQIMKTECTHDEQFYITTIHGTLLNNNPFNQCIIKNIRTHKAIKQFNNYDIIQCHPTKNIIALGATQKISNTPTLILYNINTRTITELVYDENIRFIAFSPNGAFIAATYNNADNANISLWRIADTNEKFSLIGHTEIIDALAFNPQSTYIISGSPEIENCIILWDIKNIYCIERHILLTKQHCHFKKFIFSKNGSSALATTNLNRSFFLPFSDNKSPNIVRLQTPLYALFNAPTIPEKKSYINKSYNRPENHDPYTIITTYEQPDNHYMVKVNQNETRTATYQANHTLHLYTLSLKNKTIQRKELDGHYKTLHSLEFNNDELLVSACPHKTIIWDHKGKELQVIPPKCYTCNAYLSKTGQYLFTMALSKHDSYASACTEVTQLYNTATARTYKNISKNLSTPQAVVLNAIYKKSKRGTEYIIQPRSLDNLAIDSFNNPDECKLIHQTFMIMYSK
jgi:WD40 repeat protein